MQSRKVEIVIPTGLTDFLLLPENATVRDLKLAVELEFGIPFELQTLKVKGAENTCSDELTSLSLLDTVGHSEVIVSVGTCWLKLVTSCLNKDTKKILACLATETALPLDSKIFLSILISISQWNNEYILSLINEVILPCISRRTKSGRTILHIAAAHDNVDCAKSILRMGGTALLSAADCKGETPVEIAQRLGRKEVLTAMREAPLGEVITRNGRPVCEEITCEKSKVGELAPRRIKLSRLHCSPYSGNGGSVGADSKESPLLLSRRGQRECTAHQLSRSHDLSYELNDSTTSLNVNALTAGTVEIVDLRPVHDTPQTEIRMPPVIDSDVRKMSSILIDSLPSLTSNSNGMDGTKTDLSRLQRSGDVPLNNRRRSVVFQTSLSKSEREIQCSENVYLRTRKDQHGGLGMIKKTTRAVSLGTLSTDDLNRFRATRRPSRPWNDYFEVTKDGGQDLCLQPKILESEVPQSRQRRKSFQEWVMEKVQDESSQKQKEEEEKMKAASEKALQEEKRRRKSKSYHEWLVVKTKENELQREEEKKKVEQDKVLQQQQNVRKAMSEAKYQRWLQSKYEEELAKEETLKKLMDAEWKKKEELWNARRASVDLAARRASHKTVTS